MAKNFEQWISSNWGDWQWVVLSTVGVYAAILVCTRITGLRSLSKMSAADFVMTVAVGSLLASTAATPKPSLVVGVIALATLYAAKWLIALGRRKVNGFNQVVDNTPMLLMAGDNILDDNLNATCMTREDLYAKLREANVVSLSQVQAVVFEATGDVTVLHNNDVPLDRSIFKGIKDEQRLFEV